MVTLYKLKFLFVCYFFSALNPPVRKIHPWIKIENHTVRKFWVRIFLCSKYTFQKSLCAIYPIFGTVLISAFFIRYFLFKKTTFIVIFVKKIFWTSCINSEWKINHIPPIIIIHMQCNEFSCFSLCGKIVYFRWF